MRYLSLCCIAKEEGPFVREWVAYHTLLGVEHFYIYDNMGSVPISESLGDYVGKKLVTVIPAPGPAMQLPVYNACLKDFGKDTFWMGFIDMDEFICPHQDDDARLLLSEFETYAALGLNWQVFSSNGHLRRPDMPVLEAYTEALLPDHCLIKSIVQPKHTLGISDNPHAFIYNHGMYCVTDEHRPISPGCPRAVSSRRLAQLNHYCYRSQQDFEVKIQRGRATTVNPIHLRTLDIFYKQAQWETRPDTSAARFLPLLNKKLQADKLPAPRPIWPIEAPFDAVLEAVMTLLQRNKYKDAELCLCMAGVRHADKAEFWLLRAIAARSAGRFARAEHFLNQSLKRAELPNAFLELFYLAQAKGDLANAEVRLLAFEGLVKFTYTDSKLRKQAQEARKAFCNRKYNNTLK